MWCSHCILSTSTCILFIIPDSTNPTRLPHLHLKLAFLLFVIDETAFINTFSAQHYWVIGFLVSSGLPYNCASESSRVSNFANLIFKDTIS